MNALTPEAALRTYIRAKDENRPHLMARTFSPDAHLVVQLRTNNIALPSCTRGRDRIADVLVSSFALTYENIYTFCMKRPPAAAPAFSCNWMVAMSEKGTGRPRVGCGRYDWEFAAGSGQVARLNIAIEAMEVLPPTEADAVFAWVEPLDYPWADAARVCASAPDLPSPKPVLDYLRQPAPPVSAAAAPAP
jgi:hypothetical protein